MKISIGSDHRGYPLKEQVKTELEKLGHTITDVGPFGTDSVDYPDFAGPVAEFVAQGKCDRGIMIDGAGVGSAIVANKVPGARAVSGFDCFTVLNSRKHNNTNVLTLGSEVTGPMKTMEIIKLWLNTDYEGGRHQSRIDKITAVEKKYAVDLSGIYEIVKGVITGLKLKPGNKGNSSISRKLITLERAEKLTGGEVSVSRSTVITPSARDFLRDKGIKVTYID